MQVAKSSRFITIPFSHYCEKARWALDRAGHSYHEEPHSPGFHRIATKAVGAQGSVPVLVTAERRVIDDSTAILQHVGAEARLFPVDSLLRDDVMALEERFDTELGPHLRRSMYFHALADASVAKTLLGKGVPWWERALLVPLFPALRRFMKKSMRIDVARAAKSDAIVRAVFADVGRRLSDGRKWLVGDTFTAADLTFAALAAPAIRPAAYAKYIPSEDILPPTLRSFIDELRASPAGQFALRVYDEERNRVVG